MDSVLAFLKKVQDVIGQFSDPFQLEEDVYKRQAGEN